MTGLVDEAMMAETLLAAGFSMEGAVPGPSPLASPSYKALESRSVLIGDMFAKRVHPEMREGFDFTAAMQAAHHAGEAGVGPKVLSFNAETGFIAMQALLKGWSTADQGTLQDAGVVASAMAAMKAFHQTAPLLSRFDPFAQIDALIRKLRELDAPLPEDIV